VSGILFIVNECILGVKRQTNENRIWAAVFLASRQMGKEPNFPFPLSQQLHEDINRGKKKSTIKFLIKFAIIPRIQAAKPNTTHNPNLPNACARLGAG
jgi:hypothetical protein